MFGLADEAEIEHALDAAAGVDHRAFELAGADQTAVLAADADRQRASAVDQAGHHFVDGAGKHHLDHLDHRLVGDAQAVDEGGLDGEALEHRVDLRPSAMHHHRVHADLLEQGDVAAELVGEFFLAHRVATVFHHDGRTGISAQIGQGVGENPRLLGGRFELCLLIAHDRHLS